MVFPSTAVLHANMRARPTYVVGSHGNFLQTEDGREILDATGGAAVAVIGHNDSRIQAAVMDQMARVAYCYAPFFSTPVAEELSQFLTQSTDGEMDRVFIVSSGTEAVEAALKMARQFFTEGPNKQMSRTKFIARQYSYHGNTLGSLAAGSHIGRRAVYEPILATNVEHVSPCYPYRHMDAGESKAQYVKRLAKDLEDKFQACGPETVCAFIAETVSGSTLGCTPPTSNYLKAMKEVCDRHGALFILDEVMSGMGRTGTLHAWEQEGVVPDLQTVAKGLGAGYLPIGALLVNKRVTAALMNGSGSFAHSQTYQGHPVACAAALAVQKIIREERLLENVRQNGKYFGQLLREKLGNHKNVGDIRGRGFFWGIEFVADRETKEPFPAEQGPAGSLFRKGLQPEFSISLMPSTGNVDGRSGDMILLCPAFNATKGDLELIVEKTAGVVCAVLGE